nr:hypothetical protein Iba_chr01dCG2120 [Ipomoea batatas]
MPTTCQRFLLHVAHVSSTCHWVAMKGCGVACEFWFPRKPELGGIPTGIPVRKFRTGAETGFRICVRKPVRIGAETKTVRTAGKQFELGKIFPAVGFSSRSGFFDGEEDEDLNLLMELWSWWRWSFDVDGVLL